MRPKSTFSRWLGGAPAAAIPVALLAVLGVALALSIHAGGPRPEDAEETPDAREMPAEPEFVYVVETDDARHALLELEELGEWQGGEVMVLPAPVQSGWLQLGGSFLADVDPERIVNLRGP